MANELFIHKFRIDFYGDRSVGIQEAHWDIVGDFYFDNKEHLHQFAGKLREAWELVCDTPFYITGLTVNETHHEQL